MCFDKKSKIYAERLRQLERLGLVMPSEYQLLDTRPSEVAVEQCENESLPLVTDLPDGKTLYDVWISLWAERPGVRLSYYRLEPPWRDHGFLELPRFADSHVGEQYRLPGELELPRSTVLNLNFCKTGWPLPSTRVEGVLCAWSATPIPKQFRHGATIPVTVRLFDRGGQQLAETTVTLWVDRLTHQRERAQHTAKARMAQPRTGTNAPSRSANPQSNRSCVHDQTAGNNLSAESQRGERGHD